MDACGWLVQDRRSTVRKKRRFIPAPATEPGAESCRTLLTGMKCWQTPDGPLSLVEARLLTGRTHQIRASLFSLGFPVVGDKLYGLDDGIFLRFMDDGLTPEDIRRLVLPYQALHCASLEFQGPDGEGLALSAPAPWEGLVRSP
jgi:23S rRNA pseudouridine955/2504/2580 synthase/23S rRNA pseudouridine1911/1915/1917 synthase